MNGISSRPIPCQPNPERKSRWLARTANRIKNALAEMHEAERKAVVRRMAYDTHLAEPDAAPGTYAEFLLRTSGPLLREPSARRRAAGRAVR
jgi:hypothetical protein